SPDLSARIEKPGDCGGNPGPERALACGYGTINVIAPSPGDAAEVWVGTDDGLVWLTRDGTRSWQRVTPPGVPAWAKIASIDLVAARPGTAYVAVDNHRQDDVRPYAFVTHDYGASWAAIGANLPAGHYLSVVRADPERAGLLYAGTELGVQVSDDDGAHWQPLGAGLPPVWVHDLLVKDRDLVAATVGRALWVLDDLTPLRQRGALAGPRLYHPAPAWRLRVNQNRDTPFTRETPLGQNPPTGAVIDYVLPAAARAPVELEIRDAGGALVRRFTSADAPEEGPEPYFERAWLPHPRRLEASAGAHRFVWDLRYPPPRALAYEWSIAASPAEGTQLTPGGALVLPGEYRLTLTVDGRRLEAPLAVVADPRVPVPAAELAGALDFWRALTADLDAVWRAYAEIGAVRSALADRRAALAHAPSGAALAARVAALDARLAPLAAAAVEAQPGLGFAGEALAAIVTDVEGADRAPTGAQREAAETLRRAAAAAIAQWHALAATELPSLNRALATARLPAVRVPDAAHLKAAEPPEGDDLP
ncbi:MAG: exo-alpha-sialidase, partial [Proteobacteria bacterium]|nr:exo-alpha-sialidase [Pseudomonadota bacterium]